MYKYNMCTFVSVLRKQFVSPPITTTVEQYGQTTVRCLAPTGVPAAHQTWLKNGSPIVYGSNSNVIVSAEGHLLISQATLQVLLNIHKNETVKLLPANGFDSGFICRRIWPTTVVWLRTLLARGSPNQLCS